MTTTIIKYSIKRTNKFKKQYKKMLKQGKDENKIINIITSLANGEKLLPKYKDHLLKDNKYFEGCRECHIEPDWLLVYKYQENELILFLIETGSHSEIF